MMKNLAYEPEEEMEALLPFYVNGTLQGDGRVQFERYLREQSGGSEQLEQERALLELVRASAEQPATERGWEQLLQRIRSEGTPTRWLHQLSAWFDSMAMRPGAAVAALVIVVQTGMIAALWHHSESPPGKTQIAATRSVDTPTRSAVPLLRITFQPESRESDIRVLLVGMGAKIVGGPSQLGDYFVEIPQAGSTEALARLKASGIVMSVVESPPRPTDE
jgi:hypothetical protein